MSMYIGGFFVVLGILSGGIRTIEKQNLSDLDKFNKKYEININQEDYCKFQGMQTIRSARDLLLLECMYILFEVEKIETIRATLIIYIIIGTYFGNKRIKKFIEQVRYKNS